MVSLPGEQAGFQVRQPRGRVEHGLPAAAALGWSAFQDTDPGRPSAPAPRGGGSPATPLQAAACTATTRSDPQAHASTPGNFQERKGSGGKSLPKTGVLATKLGGACSLRAQLNATPSVLLGLLKPE